MNIKEKLARKPKIGFLGLMAGSYEPIFPGIIAQQEAYVRDILKDLDGVADFDFPRAATNRQEIEEIVEYFNHCQYDGIIICLLTYSAGMHCVRALKNNNLPLLMAVIQPDQTVGVDFREYELTVNQGIHGAQDNWNAILRMGIPCCLMVENRKTERFRERVESWCYAAKTATALKTMTVGVIGRSPGMGDILMDDAAFMRVIGPETVHEYTGSIYKYMVELTDEEVQVQYEKDYQIFDVDPNLAEKDHKDAIKIYLALKKLCEEKGWDAYTLHFDSFGADGRFRQLPLYAASNLMADGYGYSAEGDICCAVLVSMGHMLCGISNFTEMYTIDYDLDAVICCHAGEGNWATTDPAYRPRLIDRYLGEGGLENPPTPIFQPHIGEATLVSLVAIKGDKFRLVVSKGQILEKFDMDQNEMPYLFYKPDCGIRHCAEEWMRAGGTHHEVITAGDTRERWKMLCEMLQIEYHEVV